jgi:Methylase involved in ubiquinone/menaquinone biosynthesis
MTRKSRELSDKQYAGCFDLFKTVSTEWDALECWLRQEFIPVLKNDDSVDILSIGSGRGDFDIVLMRLVSEKYSHISYTAVDPNTEHNSIFREKVDKFRVKPEFFTIIPEFFSDDTVHGSFDIIHLTHCLYYIPDRKNAIETCYQLLKPGGSLLIFHQTTLGINEVQERYMERVKGNRKELFSAHDLLTILENLGISFMFDVLISDLDVTDIVSYTPKGRKLLEFFLESDLDGVDDLVLPEIVAYIKENCRVTDGKYLLFHPSSIFWIKKD